MSVGYESSLALSPRAVQAFSLTQETIRSHSKTFYFATGLLPRLPRNAIRALYAFCRATDDLVDRQHASLDDVEHWRQQLRLPLVEQTNPILLAWAITREHYDVDTRYEDELIAGVAFDIGSGRHYQTWADLEAYCYHVASTVGLLSMPIIGLAAGASFEQAAPYAIQLGIALQLTNILRDVGEDAARGRVYFPQEDLERFNLTRLDILHGVQDERFTALMKFEIERARQLYAQALPGVALLHKTARPAVAAAALLYREILNEIERIQYQVHARRAHTSGSKKVRMLPGILLAVLKLTAAA